MYLVASDTITLNDGAYGGLVKVIDLVTKLNNLENKVNSIITAYNAHSHPGNGLPTASTITGSLIPTNRNDIENTKINHGS